MIDQWHCRPHSERHAIAQALGLSADNHFRSVCGYLGLTYGEIRENPVLAVEIARLERAAAAQEAAVVDDTGQSVTVPSER